MKAWILPLMAALISVGTSGIAASINVPPPKAMPANVKALLKQAGDQDDICRGTYQEGVTEKACARRDALVDAIASFGWCWGPDDVAAYQRQWIRCQQSKRPN